MADNRDSNKLNQFRLKMNELEKAKRDVDRLRQDAIAELLLQRKEINRELRQLGYEGGTGEEGHGGHNGPRSSGARPAELSLSDLTPPPPRGVRRRPAPHPERHCPICDVDGHDSRAHRGQEIKEPFTPAELREKGLAVDPA